MTHHTEAERPCWRDRADEIEQQVGMGKMDAMACYTQMVQLLDAERRTPAVPVPQGWKLVPSESTEEMARAFRADDAPHYFVMTTMRCNDFAERYRAAISAAPQPPEAALVPSIAVTPEMVEAANEAYCPFGDMELALCAALQVAPIPPGAAPVQLPENIREGEPYDNPAFEALARALGVWGTAQSAVCAQFWIAAKEQST